MKAKNKLKLLALTGPAGCGKDTAADILVEKHGFIKVSFAHAMKEGLKVMFGLTDEHVNGNLKGETIPGLGVSPRCLLQTLGTEWGRGIIGNDIWIDLVAKEWGLLLSSVDETFYTGMVISDLRFENEADWVRSQGGTVVHVLNKGMENIPESDHKSESSVVLDVVNDFAPLMNPQFSCTNGLCPKTEYSLNISRMLETINKMDRMSTESTPDLSYDVVNDPLQGFIAKWADSVFPNRTITNAIQKLVLEEIPEYLTSQHDPMELADIAILVYDIAHLAGVDLEKAIKEKMKINIEREWEVDPITGLMGHIK